jgi:hypothetical protein
VTALDRAVRRAAGALHRLEECLCARRDRSGAGRRRGAPDAIRPHVRRSPDSDHSSELAASQRARGAESRHAPGPPGQETAPAGDRGGRGGECVPRDDLLAAAQPALAQAPAAAADFHRRCPAATRLDRVFRLEATRTIGHDWVVRYHNRALQLARQSGYAPARSTVTVCEWPDGRLAVEYRGRTVSWTEITSQPSLSPAAPVVVLPRPAPRPPHTANHPWRRTYKGIRPDVPLWRVADQ